MCSEWRFGVMSCLKGNCFNGDIECENGKSDRTYDARFTYGAGFYKVVQLQAVGCPFFYLFFVDKYDIIMNNIRNIT